MLAIIPLDLFPATLPALVIALGLVHANLAALMRAWCYNDA